MPIEILGNGIKVLELLIPRKDLADFFKIITEDERETTFIQALEIGIYCLERAKISQDTNFVRRQVESLLSEVEKAVMNIPEETKKELLNKIGTGEGQILAPIQDLINQVSKNTADKLREVKDLLSQELDPARDTSTIGKVLKSLKDILDPQRKDSVQGAFESAIQGVTTEEGALAKTVKSVVADAVKPLADEMDRLAKEIRGQEAAIEALEDTVAKGLDYENEVVGKLQFWAKFMGAEVYHVGGDNRPGDIIIKFPVTSPHAAGSPLVVEVRDRKNPLGRKAISDTLSLAMIEREACAAIYLSRYQEGLAKEIGDWAEGGCDSGPWVATTDDHLITSLRFLLAQRKLEEIKSGKPEVDTSLVEDQIKRIRTSLGRIKTINQKITSLRGTTNEIQQEVEGLRDEIRSALFAIEDTIRAVDLDVRVSGTV
jgi:hypothetical protein